VRKCVSMASAALFVCLSCCTVTDGDGEIHGPTTVLELLERFEEAWINGDSDEYRILLDEKNFTFYFDPRDVQDRGVPPSWGYDDEIETYSNLFDEVGTSNVDVCLDFSDVNEPEEGTENYKVEGIEYRVLLYNPDDGFTYLAQAFLDLELAKVDGEWIVTDWWDKATYRLLVEETTWGMIKYMFYEE
jgi:hypothetical protein